MRHYVKPGALAGALALVVSAAGADTIRATSGFGPSHPAAVYEYPEIDARLQEFTDGAWDLQDTPSGLVTPTEMSSGLRIRTGAPLYARLVDTLGGEASQIPSSELFESLSQGVIDGTFSANHEIIANRLGDVVQYVTVMNEGVFNGAATATASNLLWMRMSPEERAALARASQYGVSKGLFGFNDDAAEAREIEGLVFIEMDDSLRAAKEAYNQRHLENVAAILADRGVQDAQAKVDRYSALVEKWEGLITDDMTYEDLAELRYEEIFSKLDFGSYGM